MFTQLLTEAYFPFSISLGLFLGLLILELIFALLGGTLLGLGGDNIDLDGPDLDTPELGDLDLDLGDVDIDSLELASFEDIDAPAVTDTGLSAWLGFGRMPALIWLGTVLAGFGLAGITLQQVMAAVFTTALPAWLAALPAAIGSLWFAGRFGAVFARLLPKDETQSVSERHLGRRKGVVSQGTAARGRPAEVRVSDRFGNTHYLRAEPLRDNVSIAQGTEVIVLRQRYDEGYRIVALGDI